MVPEWVHVATLGATIILALVAALSAGISFFLLRRHVDPHVIVYATHDPDRPSSLMLVIENIGKSVAHNINFRLSRPVPQWAPGISPTEEPRDYEPMDEGPLVEGIPALAPGEERVINWGQFGGLLDSLQGSVEVTATFTGRSHLPIQPSEHTVTSILEVESFRRTDAAKSQKRQQTKHLEEIASSLETLAKGASPRMKQTSPDNPPKPKKSRRRP